MSVLFAAYVLVWPAMVAISLGVMCRAIVRDAQKARENGESLV